MPCSGCSFGNAQVLAGGALVGLLAGLGIAWHVTRGWDKHRTAYQPQLALGVLPAPGGALATARLTL